MRRPIAAFVLIGLCGAAALASAVWSVGQPALPRDHAMLMDAAWVRATAALELAASAAAATATFGARIPSLVAAGYQHAPEMIIGLGTALSFPLVALASFVIRWATRRRRDRLRLDRAARISRMDHGPPPEAKAWLEVDGASGSQDHQILGEMLRIGRDVDNELALADSGVQQFHALIRRTPEAEFMVIDVTGVEGAGIAVNGLRLRSSRLRDGDRIELGHTAMTFHRAVRRAADRGPGN